MKKNKTILTKNIKNIKILDYCAWLIPVLILVYLLLFKSFGDFILQCIFEENEPVIAVAVIIILVFTVTIFTLPIMFIWKAVTKTLKKSAIKNTTFNILQDLEYYRDKFTGISPTAISMTVDLEIEPQKDISALILKYTLMNVVTTDNEKIKVKNINHPDLKESDKFLLEHIAGNTMSNTTVEQWKKLAKKEAVAEGYVVNVREDKKFRNKTCFTTCATGCIIPILIMIAAITILYSDIVSNFTNFADGLTEGMTNVEVIRSMLSTMDNSLATFVVGVMFLMVSSALVLPIVSIIYIFVKMFTIKCYKRTQKGEELVEQIYGMKNFIHDYSYLSTAEKEKLILWDDFLIYAVLLEENTDIVDEICNLKKVNWKRGRFYFPKL